MSEKHRNSAGNGLLRGYGDHMTAILKLRNVDQEIVSAAPPVFCLHQENEAVWITVDLPEDKRGMVVQGAHECVFELDHHVRIDQARVLVGASNVEAFRVVPDGIEADREALFVQLLSAEIAGSPDLQAGDIIIVSGNQVQVTQNHDNGLVSVTTGNAQPYVVDLNKVDWSLS